MKKLYKTFLLLTVFLFLTTYTPNTIDNVSKKDSFFFIIKNIEVTNNNLIKKEEITKKLEHIYYKNILFVNKRSIEEPLKLIEFLEKAEVKKKYPNTIIVKVYETRPLAFFFKNNEKYFLDSLSNLIPYKKKWITGNIPTLFGQDAEKNFVKFFDLLEKNKFPKEKIKNYYYFQIHRWDLQLINDKIIKFPSIKVSKAIQDSIELLNRDDFKNYNIIDLRVPGKIVVE